MTACLDAMKKASVTGALALAMIVPSIASAATPGQDNARGKAASYLQYEAFSRSGLISQLKYEGFTTAQATYGVTAMHVNWSRQAALKAKEYLKYDSFSRRGLIEQLEFEGFTVGQATYGVSRTGL
jgi:Host cell surface-exposed lipoprotein